MKKEKRRGIIPACVLVLIMTFSISAVGCATSNVGDDTNIGTGTDIESESGSGANTEDTDKEDVFLPPEEVYLSLLNCGSFTNTYQLKAKSFEGVICTSDDDSIAMVNNEGVIQAVGIGGTKIHLLFDEGQSFDIDVTVASGIIDEKSDLDYLAAAYQNEMLSLWDEENYYLLACDVDYNGETFIPIAPLDASIFSGEWGVFGELNNGHTFAATIDGKGHSISNAVIPYGTVLTDKYGAGGAFIGNFSGVLKNVFFENTSTENARAFKISNPESGFQGDWDINQMQGIVSVNAGLIENVYVEMLLNTAALGQDSTGGVLIAKNTATGIVRCCITEVSILDASVWDGGIVGRFWNGVNGEEGKPSRSDWDYLSDIGLIIGTNNGLMENCFTIVENEGFKTTGSTTVYEYLPMFYGGFYAGWTAGPNYKDGMGNGVFTNLQRFSSLNDLLGSISSKMFVRYGYNTSYWESWWGIF